MTQYKIGSAGLYPTDKDYRNFGLAALICTLLTALVFFILPDPFNFMVMLAITGPNFVAYYTMFKYKRQDR